MGVRFFGKKLCYKIKKYKNFNPKAILVMKNGGSDSRRFAMK
jgi:hypothetical protein